MKLSKISRYFLLVVVVALLLEGAALYWRGHVLSGRSPRATSPAIPPLVNVEPEQISRSGSDGLDVPPEVAGKMRLQTATVTVAHSPLNLPTLQGVLALDNDRLSRVHSRFGGEVVELGSCPESADHSLHVGDFVHQGDLLAVVWSTELGEKKSALVDAMVKARAEQQLLERLKKLYEEGAGAGRSFRDAERDVQTRRAEIASLERTLRIWRVTDEDIEDIHAEVRHVTDESSSPIKASDWARVEVRAPMSGVILEKNVHVGDIVDTSGDLFKIGDLSTLAVWAHVYEEDLALLQSLPRPIPWTLTVSSQPGKEFAGTLDKIGAVIEPAQHTALVSGRVENPRGELKVGQFVSATVTLPVPQNELELPATALVDDGPESVVFVQIGAQGTRFARRPVSVVRRLQRTVYVRQEDSGPRAGDRVVTSGALMLQNAMSQLPASAGQARPVEVSWNSAGSEATRKTK